MPTTHEPAGKGHMTTWFITGASDSRWDDGNLNQLKTILHGV